MSSTITQTESRTILKSTQEFPTEIILKKRENFTRSTSIEKLKKFNSFICSQHYYILPSLFLWLKTSQTMLTSNMEKCMLYVKSMFLISTVQCLQEQTKDNSFAAFFKLTTKDIIPIINILLIKTNELVATLYDEIKRLILVSTIYFGVALIFCQLLGIICLLFWKIPPLGFVFLVGCVVYIAHIATIVMFKPKNKQETNENDDVKTIQEKKRIRKTLTMIGKRISNVKLF